jgi:K+-transporting ATPase ATPase C chain
MLGHIRANLWLLGLTLLICSVLYPLALLGVGQVIFPSQAQGSLIYGKNGKVIGSRIVAQPFTGDEYFHPRPSAVSYNGGATGGTNWGASNPALRKRVVSSLGPILKYREGKPVGPDIVAWVKENLGKDRTILTKWSEADGNLAERWGSANADFLKNWEKAHAEATATWHKENPTTPDAPPAILAGLFFESYGKDSAAALPETDGKDLQSAFFELWWKEHPKAEFDPVPADMVMASGAGIDPHITLASALYQLDRVAAKRAEMTKRDEATVHKEIEALLHEKAAAPLGGLVGPPLINVLETNVALQEKYGS